ncbi:MAG: hypothetical protein JWN99_2558 [Ilumatobacteraceae bacterium]|nr:hypothetical protein [Ilumatobacteraceae bacterium]
MFTEIEIDTDPILRYFTFEHLPDSLRNVSQPFAMLAANLLTLTPRSAERTSAFRKLLEAKDCAVRAALDNFG